MLMMYDIFKLIVDLLCLFHNLQYEKKDIQHLKGEHNLSSSFGEYRANKSNESSSFRGWYTK